MLPQTTRVFKVYNGSQTVLTSMDMHGTHTRTLPGDLRPPGIDQLRGKPLPPSPGYRKGSADSVAGVPCHHWILDAAGATFDLCVPDPASVPPPLARGALSAQVAAGNTILLQSRTRELTTASPIDEAVFDPAAWGRGS